MKIKKARLGRRTKLTKRVKNRIVTALRAGNYTTVAAAYAGIGRATFYRWMQRGKEAQSGRYREFYEAVRQALAVAEVRAVAILRKHMFKHWKPAIFFLERRFPQRWRKPRPEDLEFDPYKILSQLFGISERELIESCA